MHRRVYPRSASPFSATSSENSAGSSNCTAMLKSLESVVGQVHRAFAIGIHPAAAQHEIAFQHRIHQRARSRQCNNVTQRPLRQAFQIGSRAALGQQGGTVRSRCRYRSPAARCRLAMPSRSPCQDVQLPSPSRLIERSSSAPTIAARNPPAGACQLKSQIEAVPVRLGVDQGCKFIAAAAEFAVGIEIDQAIADIGLGSEIDDALPRPASPRRR